MGFLDVLFKAVEILPGVVDSLDKLGLTSTSETDPDELIEECEECLTELPKFSIDEVDEALHCLSRFERRWLKLQQIDLNTNGDTLSRIIDRLDTEKEKVLSNFEKKLQDHLDELCKACKDENDPEKWQVLNDEWFHYTNESEKIIDHRIEFLEKFTSIM